MKRSLRRGVRVKTSTCRIPDQVPSPPHRGDTFDGLWARSAGGSDRIVTTAYEDRLHASLEAARFLQLACCDKGLV